MHVHIMIDFMSNLLFPFIQVPPGPFFEVFSVAKSHNNVSISWILSGVAAESINVSID